MNPFEIRLQVLEMAKDYLDKQFDIINQSLEIEKDMAEKLGQMVTDPKAFTPQTYTMKDLMDKASEFYSFVAPKTK